MIEGFRKSKSGRETERIFDGQASSMFPASIQRQALRKLVLLDGAVTLQDLSVPAGNNLHSLRGDREGQHAIRINDQYRVVFIWSNGNVYDVEIVDYH